VKITSIRLDRMRLPLDPPFHAAWDPVPRRHFDADLGVLWLEEPLPGGDLDGMRALRGLVRVAGRDFFLTAPVRIDADGYLAVPDAPGLGAQIDHEAVTRYARPA